MEVKPGRSSEGVPDARGSEGGVGSPRGHVWRSGEVAKSPRPVQQLPRGELLTTSTEFATGWRDLANWPPPARSRGPVGDLNRAPTGTCPVAQGEPSTQKTPVPPALLWRSDRTRASISAAWF